MQMLEVMRRLNSESEVMFLLSAYVETLQHCDFGQGLPGCVAVLPVRGVGDVRDRFEALLDVELSGAAAQAGRCVHAIAREATEVFGVALTRMQSLQAVVRAAPVRKVELVF